MLLYKNSDIFAHIRSLTLDSKPKGCGFDWRQYLQAKTWVSSFPASTQVYKCIPPPPMNETVKICRLDLASADAPLTWRKQHQSGPQGVEGAVVYWIEPLTLDQRVNRVRFPSMPSARHFIHIAHLHPGSCVQCRMRPLFVVWFGICAPLTWRLTRMLPRELRRCIHYDTAG